MISEGLRGSQEISQARIERRILTICILRREKSFCKIFREFFRSFCEVFQSFRKFFEVFASFSRLSDPFGPIGMHWDAFGSNLKRLDVFENFDFFWIFESFFNVSGRNFYKRLF